MRIPSGSTDRWLGFTAKDTSDNRLTGLALGDFVVSYNLNGGTPATMTTPTVTETSAALMPGDYDFLVDESAMTALGAGHDTEELKIHISHTGGTMKRVTRVTEIYRPETTEGQTLTVAAGALASVGSVTGAVGSVTGNVDGSTASVTGSVGSVVGAVGSVTAPVTASSVTGNVAGSVNSVTFPVTAGNMRGTDSAALASVCTEARLSELDAAGEPAQGAPPASAGLKTKVAYLYMAQRNKATQTGVLRQVFADNGTTVVMKATTSDAAGLTTKEKFVSGP